MYSEWPSTKWQISERVTWALFVYRGADLRAQLAAREGIIEIAEDATVCLVPTVVSVENTLVERFHLDDRCTVIAADPKRAGILRIVDIDATDVGRAGQHVFRVLPALNVEAGHTVGQHGPGPRLAVAVEHLPLRHAFGLGIEHADGVALVFAKPQPALAIDATAPRA